MKETILISVLTYLIINTLIVIGYQILVIVRRWRLQKWTEDADLGDDHDFDFDPYAQLSPGDKRYIEVNGLGSVMATYTGHEWSVVYFNIETHQMEEHILTKEQVIYG